MKSLQQLMAEGLVVKAAQVRRGERRPRDSRYEPWRFTAWEPWTQVYPLLRQLFGEDCLHLTPEDTVLPNPEDPSAFKVLAILAEGVRRKGWRWVPETGDAVLLLRVYKAFLISLGETGGGPAVRDLAHVVSRLRRGATDAVDIRALPTIVGGFAYRIVVAKAMEKPYLMPSFGGWNELLDKNKHRNMLMAYARGVHDGHIPENAYEFLDKLSVFRGREHGLLGLTMEEAMNLLVIKTIEQQVIERIEARHRPGGSSSSTAELDIPF